MLVYTSQKGFSLDRKFVSLALSHASDVPVTLTRAVRVKLFTVSDVRARARLLFVPVTCSSRFSKYNILLLKTNPFWRKRKKRIAAIMNGEFARIRRNHIIIRRTRGRVACFAGPVRSDSSTRGVHTSVVP